MNEANNETCHIEFNLYWKPKPFVFFLFFDKTRIDTDSGIGRATPPRRAASPGMGLSSARHLPSPSGPGSLPPGFMNKRGRIFDDGSSDISSTPSSMMEYSGL